MRAYPVLFYMKENSLPLEDASLPRGRIFHTAQSMGSVQVKHQLFNPIRNPYTQTCPSHNPASSTQRRKVNSFYQCQIHSLFSSGYWTGTSPPSASHHAVIRPAELSRDGYRNPSGFLQHHSPLTAPKAVVIPSTDPHGSSFSFHRSGTDTDLAHSSQAGEYGAVDIDFLGGGESRSRRLA